MPTNLGRVEYPGLQQYHSFSGTWNIGITPSVMTILAYPQDLGLLYEVGDLVLRYDADPQQVVTFKNCLLDSADGSSSEGGKFVSIKLRDYRWAWQYALISGWYNVRRADGQLNILENAQPSPDDVVGHPQRSMRELALICTKALDIISPNLGEVPDDVYPETRWENTPAANALSELIEPLRLVVVPQPDGTLDIRKLGVGVAPPTGSYKNFNQGLDPQERPRKLIVRTSANRYTWDFDLEPVGMEPTGEFRRINELSWIPSGYDPETATDQFAWTSFGQPQAGDTPGSPEARGRVMFRDLATRSLFKMYKIMDQVSGADPTQWLNWKIQNLFGTDTTMQDFYGDDFKKENVKYLAQFLPISNALTQTFFDSDGNRISRSGFVYGAWCPYTGPTSFVLPGMALVPGVARQNGVDYAFEVNPEKVYLNNNGQPAGDRWYTIVPQQPTIIEDKGIVIFSNVVARNDPNNPTSTKFVYPHLRLRCSFAFRQLSTGEYLRRDFERMIAPLSVLPQIVDVHPEISYVHYGWTSDAVKENLAVVQQEAEYYLDDREAQLEISEDTAGIQYIGLAPVVYDGKITSAHYSIGPQGSTTTVSWGRDRGSPTTIPFSNRRQFEKQRLSFNYAKVSRVALSIALAAKRGIIP